MWELDHKEGWPPKNWCFQTEVLKKTLESPLDCKEIQSAYIIKEINPEYSLEGLMLKLKLQYSGHLMQRADSLEKAWCWGRLKAGGEGDYIEWDGWMASPSQWTWVWACCRRWWSKGKPDMQLDTTEQLTTTPASKIIKYLAINPPKETKDLYSKN